MLTDFEWQEYQGVCQNCNFRFMEFLQEKTEMGFKYCIGFIEPVLGHYGQPYIPLKDFMGCDKLIIGFECPKCFTKSGFHVNKNWKDKYSKWIKQGEIK